MAAPDKLRVLAESLDRARAEHARLMQHVEGTRELVETQHRDLQALEQEIADLEHQYRELTSGGGSSEPTVPRRAVLIHNPKSGQTAIHGGQLDYVLNCLRAHGIDADVAMKKSAKGTRQLARAAVRRGEGLVIAAGGDGTIEDVASQLVGSATTLGIIPIGTMNNVARALGIPLLMEDACALLGMGQTRAIDLGRVVAHTSPPREYFLETSGVGLSAVAIPAGDAAKSGRWAALPDALRKLFNIKPQPMLLEFDDGRMIEANSQVVTVSNAPLIGNNILVAPDAKMDDGLLDVAVYNGMNKAELLAHFVAASNGNRAENPKIMFFRTRRVRIHTSEPVAVHSDKDEIEAKKMVQIEVIPQGLSIIVGQGIALTRPVENVPSVPPLSGPQSAEENQLS